MTLTAGTRLGRYEVTSLLGVGGMGEVYRATDTTLKRSVAVKVLPASMTDDADRLARFQREAEILAALNHPNIAAIYGLERHAGVTALVMELVDGPTLADRVAQGAVPLDEALPVARQLAAALEAAHEQGIVHRDLKPANIKVRQDGVVKVLDFGLAKLSDPPVGNTVTSQSPTITTPAMTQAGMILGTAAYMSPEQARGKPVDARADIWAFGCVVYELLTGCALFAGDTITDVLAAVVTREPDWGGVPRPLRRLLEACLRKDPRQRLRDIGDVWHLLDPDETHGGASASVAQPLSRWRRVLPWAAALGAAATVVGVVTLREGPPQPPEVVRFDLQVALEAGGSAPEISPNGRHLVYQTSQGIFVRDLDAVEPRLVATTDNPVGHPFWSWDSRSIAYATSSKLMRVDLAGGPPQPICDPPGIVLGALWLADDRILVSANQGVYSVPAQGGALTETELPPLSIGSGSQMLPDGSRFVYASRTGTEDARGLFVGRIDGTGEPVRLLPDHDTAVAFVATDQAPVGYLVFQRQGALLAQAFDPSRAELSGDPMVVAADVQGFTASANGHLVYLRAAGGRRLTWFDRRGTATGTAWAPGLHLELSLSPDGSRVAVVRADDGPTTWIHDFSREASMRLLQSGAAVKPIWSPDGRRIAYAGTPVGRFRFNLSSAFSTGDGTSTPLLESTTFNYPNSWSLDGRWLLYTNVDLATKEDLWVLPMADGAQPTPQPFLVTSFRETDGAFSPDGQRVAYVSDESGVPEVHVRSFPAGTAGKWTISTGGGYQPRWRRDGRELLYISGKGELMSVDVGPDSSFSATRPRRLFQMPIYGGGPSLNNRYWDLTPDGQRFLATTTAEGAGTSTLTVVLNWRSAFGR